MPPARILLCALPCLLGSACSPPDDGQQARAEQAPPAELPLAAKQAYQRGSQLYQEERPLEAVAALQEAVTLAPDWAKAHLDLGKLLFSLVRVRFGTATRDHARLDSAIAELSRARELEPENAEAAFWAGQALFLADRNAEAQRMFEATLALAPDHGEAHKQLGLLHEAEGDVARARASLERARELRPTDDEVLFHLAMQHENVDDLRGAVELHLEAVKANPAHPGPRTRLVALYQRLGEPEQAAEASAGLARCKEFGRRLTAATQESQANPRDPAAMLAVAELYLELGMLASARSWAERAQRLDPESAAVKEVLGRIEEREGGQR